MKHSQIQDVIERLEYNFFKKFLFIDTLHLTKSNVFYLVFFPFRPLSLICCIKPGGLKHNNLNVNSVGYI